MRYPDCEFAGSLEIYDKIKFSRQHHGV